jgi:hypothetical protein
MPDLALQPNEPSADRRVGRRGRASDTALIAPGALLQPLVEVLEQRATAASMPEA